MLGEDEDYEYVGLDKLVDDMEENGAFGGLGFVEADIDGDSQAVVHDENLEVTQADGDAVDAQAGSTDELEESKSSRVRRHTRDDSLHDRMDRIEKRQENMQEMI